MNSNRLLLNLKKNLCSYFNKHFDIKNVFQLYKMIQIERGGSVVTHDTHIREVPGLNPVTDNLVEVFSGFLNLKIDKELVIFKGKCRIGPHIPLLLIQFNVYCFSRSETIVVKMVNF